MPLDRSDEFIQLNRIFYELSDQSHNSDDEFDISAVQHFGKRLCWSDLLKENRVILLSEAGSGCLRLLCPKISNRSKQVGLIIKPFMAKYEKHATFNARTINATTNAMKILDEIQQWLINTKPSLQALYKIQESGVFGSYSREEQAETSDLDVLVVFSEPPCLMTFLRLENDLTDNIGVKVDLVHKPGLKPCLGQRIFSEVVYL